MIWMKWFFTMILCLYVIFYFIMSLFITVELSLVSAPSPLSQCHCVTVNVTQIMFSIHIMRTYSLTHQINTIINVNADSRWCRGLQCRHCEMINIGSKSLSFLKLLLLHCSLESKSSYLYSYHPPRTSRCDCDAVDKCCTSFTRHHFQFYLCDTGSTVQWNASRKTGQLSIKNSSCTNSARVQDIEDKNKV